MYISNDTAKRLKQASILVILLIYVIIRWSNDYYERKIENG